MEQITITMSRDDWTKLVTYILMNTNARKEELEACERLAVEQENGSIKFPNMSSRADFIREQNADVERIRESIDKALCTPQIPQGRLEELMTIFKDGLIEDDEEQAYIYFEEACDLSWFEANFLGLDVDKYREYTGVDLFKKGDEENEH